MALLHYLIFIVLGLIIFWILRNLKHGRGRGIPGAWDHLLPINRSLFDFMFYPKDHLLLDRYHQKHGNTYHTKVGDIDFIVTKDLGLAKHVFENRENYPLPSLLRKGTAYEMGNNMFASEGEVWKRKHQQLQPMLRQKMLEKHAPVVYHKAQKLVDNFARMVGDEPGTNKAIEVLPHVKKLTIDVIGEVAFGTDFGALDDRVLTNNMSFPKILDIMTEGVNDRLTVPEWSWEWLKTRKHEKETAVILKQLFNEIIEETRKKPQDMDDPATLVSLLLATQEKESHLPEEEKVYPTSDIIGECFTLFGAGADTTANTLAFLLYFLASSPQVQDKANEEIAAILEKKRQRGEPLVPTYKDIKEMRYIGAIVAEAQRLCPASNYIVREVVADDVYNGIPLRAGSWVTVNVYGIHHSPDNYDNPESFIPDRWIKKDSNNNTVLSTSGDAIPTRQARSSSGTGTASGSAAPFTHLPFGYGRRSCFGKPLALMEMKFLVFLLLQRFNLKVERNHPKLQMEQTFGLRPRDNQLWLELEKK